MLADLYKSFSAEDQARLLFIAVGKTNFRSMNRNFCRGPFPATDADAWWKEFGASQRTLVVLRKSSAGRWERSCSLSMDRHSDKVKDLLVELLVQSRGRNAGGSGPDKTKTPTVPDDTNDLSITIPPAVDLETKASKTLGTCSPPERLCDASRNAVCQYGHCVCFGNTVALHGKCVQEAEAEFERIVGDKELMGVSQPAVVVDMAESRLRVAGLGSHTVSDDLMFPVLVFGFSLFVVVLVMLQRHWKATALRKNG